MSGPQPEAAARATPWYLSRRGVWLGLLVAGPLALPLLWLSPRFSRALKVLLTAAALLVTYLSVHYTGVLIARVESRMDEIQRLLQSV